MADRLVAGPGDVKVERRRECGGDQRNRHGVDVETAAHPDQRPGFSAKQRVDLGDGVFVCGDHRDTPAIQGALFSGKRTAAAVLRRLRG